MPPGRAADLVESQASPLQRRSSNPSICPQPGMSAFSISLLSRTREQVPAVNAAGCED
jgi:hypothetical protein